MAFAPKKKSQQVVTQVTQTTVRSSPIPSPEDLEKYNSVYPEASKIILEAFKNQTETRNYIEKKSVETSVYLAKAGLWMGFILSLIFLTAGSFLTYLGYEKIGIAIISLIILLSTVFVLRKIKGDKSSH